jgi:hypothetical protein
MNHFQRSTILLLVMVTLLTAGADFLLYTPGGGCTFSIFTFILLLAVLLRCAPLGILTHPSRIQRGSPDIEALCRALALCGTQLSCLYEPGPLAVLVSVSLLLDIALNLRQRIHLNLAGSPGRLLRYLGKTSWKFPRDLLILVLRNRHWVIIRAVFAATLPWIAPVLMGSVFISLFAMANPVISLGIDEAWIAFVHSVDYLLQSLSFVRLIFWLFWGWIIWSLLRTRLAPKKKAAISNREGPTFSHSFVERCLTIFNIVFAVETVTDFAYLWAGASLPRGLSYASFAHRGAYPLMVTALLAAAFVLMTFRPDASPANMQRARRLVYLWIAQNIMLIASSILRLDLYVSIYGLSRWRIAALLWMILVALGFFWIGARIIANRSNAWLIAVNTRSAAILIYLCCFVNFDSQIAWYNVRHCREVRGVGAYLDVAYLKSLAPASVPALLWLANANRPNGISLEAREFLNSLRYKLEVELEDWRSWTVLRAVTLRELRSEVNSL